MNFLYWYLALTALITPCLYLFAMNSPIGYEDEQGFHFGDEQ